MLERVTDKLCTNLLMPITISYVCIYDAVKGVNSLSKTASRA